MWVKGVYFEMHIFGIRFNVLFVSLSSHKGVDGRIGVIGGSLE